MATHSIVLGNPVPKSPASSVHPRVEKQWLGYFALNTKPMHLKLSRGYRARAALGADRKAVDIPRQWYNLIADLPVKPPPPLHPKTFEPVKPEDLSPLFPDELIKQEMSNDKFIDIPEEVLDVYRLWRPTPLIRAKRLEKLLDTPARIYYKYEGGSPAGSHKPNTAVPQVWYNAQQGVKNVVTETGAGQWGSSLAFACSLFGLGCEVWQVRASYDQKPYRRLMMQTWGAKVHPSPSSITEAGRKILNMDPSSPGSLGIAISEAVEVAAMNADTKYCLGSVLNHVLLHQTVIGEECLKQMEAIGETPDVIIGCTGGGSNFAGLSFPFIREKLNGKINPIIRAVEPTACPSLTKGVYAYDYGDTAGMTPLMKMHTLGHDFIPDPIHAGGLRYHGMAPLISHVYELGFMEALSIPQTECFQGAIQFARSEGLIPAPEPTHAIAATIREALRCRETGESKVILTAMCGHGHFDLPAYEKYLQGNMVDLTFGVFLHGFGADGITTWQFQVLALARNYRVYVPDFLFFGGSFTDKSDRSPEFQAECMAKGLRKLGVERCTLVGLSYGGMVGFKMADMYPDLVESMVVTCSVMALTESISSAALERIGFKSWPEYLLPDSVKGVELLFDVATYKLPKIPNFIYKHYFEVMTTSLQEMFDNRKEKVELLKALVIDDKDFTLTYYPQTVYLLWGGNDIIFTMEVANSLKSQLGDGATLQYIEKAGHLAQIEQPCVYNKRLKEILSTLVEDGHKNQ